jgi:hypothetical protein
VLYNDVYKAMKQAGIAMATLKRAKPRVGVKARRRSGEGKNGPWEWYLPDEAPTSQTTRARPAPDHNETPEPVVQSQEN